MPDQTPEPAPQPQGPGFWATVWEHIKTILRWIGTKLVAPGVALVIVIVAVLLVAIGWKELQIGGLLGKLFGKKDPEHKAIDIANTVPEGRVDKDGKIIPIGQPDSKGDVQAQVVPIDEPGLFSNPDTVTFTPPGADKPVEVQLPDGVKAKDVDTVVIVKPSVIAVTVKDDSKIPAQTVDDLLKKYGG
jgi:hypothetical protein